MSEYSYPLYDEVGNRKEMRRVLQADPLESVNYDYNDIYELTQVTGGQSHTYDYDGVGNREAADGISYTPNSLNQYTQVDTTAFGYDGNGNLTFDGERTLAYDPENRLESADVGGTSAQYAFDALGRRVSKAVDGASTYFIYTGDSVIAEYDDVGLLSEYVLSDNIDEVLAMERGGVPYYYHYDGLGSVTEITDVTGALVEYYEYDPYGNVSIYDGIGTPLATSSIDNPYYFTGRRVDFESGLYHYRARASIS